MIDNLFDVLYVAKTGKIKPDASLTDNLYGKKFYDAHSGIITTATGNPVSIVTNKAQNAISTILSFSPKQSGSGDPSPQNIRPIEGWTEANLTGAGKNLVHISDKTLTINGVSTSCDDSTQSITLTGLANGSGGRTNKLTDIIYLPKGTYRLSCHTVSGDTKPSFFVQDLNNTIVGYENYFTLSEPKEVYVGCNVVYNVDYAITFNLQIEVGITATAYEPYITPTTTAISLGGTYYGFEIDVERGVLRVTHTAEVFDDNDSWELVNNRFRANRVPASAYSGNVNYVVSMVNWLKYREVTASSRLNDGECTWFKNTNNLFVRVDSITSKADFETFIHDNPLVLIAELATPLELPLTPQTVALLAGNNTIWTDGDEVSITYKARG